MILKKYITSLFYCSLLITPAPLFAKDVKDIHVKDLQAAPEAATGYTEKEIVTAKKFMIVTANPYATKAGQSILAKGGSAVDAAIAAQLVLNLVEPQASGLGGGGFLLHWSETGKKLETYDGRETAPALVKPDHFIGPDGKPLKIEEAIRGGLAVGIPGMARFLQDMHKDHGKLKWAELFEPAIQLAENGFAVPERLAKLLEKEKQEEFDAAARAYFFPDGKLVAAGTVLKNPEFAKTLRMIAEKGADSFYDGTLAEQIVASVKSASNGKNPLQLSDLKSYTVKKRAPLCILYRVYKVCGMEPPSSGAVAIGQMLKLIEPFDLGKEPLNANALHVIGEAQKLAYADRNIYLADKDFIDVPVLGLLHNDYITERRKLIDPQKAMTKAEAGKPQKIDAAQYGKDLSLDRPGTTHISIMDEQGNAVSMTTTIEAGFGSRLMVGGFLLNNELTDFSLTSVDDKGLPIANKIEPGKRPRSSMAPTIVFDKETKPVLIVGSPGGSRIILYVFKTIIGVLDWNMTPQAAVSMINFGSRNGPFEVEDGPQTKAVMENLAKYGQTTKLEEMTSGLHVILKKDGVLQSGIDPRRDGMALGEE